MLTLKKGQISIFVIISAILVVVMAFVFFSGQFEFFQSYEVRLKNQVSNIVTDCVYDYADNGLFLLGYQGGYIDLPANKAINPSQHVNFGLKIATWDTQRGDIPTIASMERQLKNFIEEEALNCIETGFNSISDSLDISILGELETDVSIRNENVRIQVSLPISFREYNSEQILNADSYSVNLDSVRLGDMFNLATQIYNQELRTNFVEELVLDQIFSASDYSSEISMPSQGIHFTCSRRVWTMPQLKQNLARLNNNNFKYLYFDGTYPIDDVFEANIDGTNIPLEYRQYYKNNYVFRLDNPRNSFRNYRVELLMPSTEITGEEGIFTSYPFRTFEVNPSNGNIVRPNSLKVDVGGFNLPLPCIQLFHHTYTLDYDLIVKITDYSNDANFYSFQFPLRVLIEQNNPKTRDRSFPILQEPPTATNEVFCEEENREYPLQVYVRDTNGNYLSDVNVSYQCINLTCELGKTQRPSFMGVERSFSQPYFQGNFPFCIGGEIIVEREGFHTSKVRVDTTSDLIGIEPPIFYDLEMISLKRFNLDVSSFLVVDRETGLGSRVRTEDDGSIYVRFENLEYDFESEAIWPNNLGMLDYIELLDIEDVKYNISVFYMDGDFAFRGLIEYENYDGLNIYSGNNIKFVIPAASSEILPDDYEEFERFMRVAIRTSAYGVNFR